MVAEWCTEKGVLIQSFNRQDIRERAKMIASMYIAGMKSTLDRYVDHVRETNEKAKNDSGREK